MKKNIYFGIILLFLTILIIALYNFYTKYLNEPQFLTKKKLQDLLSLDSDGYYASFNKNDLRVRGVKNVDEYIEKLQSSCSEFSEREKELLRDCVKTVKERLQNSVKGFDTLKVSRIPIIFGCTDGDDYEEGLPHTRYPAIILNRRELNSGSSYFIVRLILHELTHLYQKMYPEDTSKYLKENGFQVIREKKLYDNIRANPDVDGFIYKNTLTDKTYEFVYKSSPDAIGDVVGSQGSTMEHPFEEMAYRMENLARPIN